MAFSSVTFLFYFLPLALLGNYLLPAKGRNGFLLLVSLFFYAWAGPAALVLLLLSILANWILAAWIARQEQKKVRLYSLAFAVSLNLGLLIYYKYAGFFFTLTHEVLGLHRNAFIAPLLPVGISFFTFHSISYLVDIYRRQAQPFVNPLDLGLYVAFFPQLISGPIVRFREIAAQIRARTIDSVRFALGIERFIYGLAKKMLLADPLGKVADHVFALDATQLGTANAWFGLLCFSLQIYFDFSGYSDMAVGLARFFGFEFPENFNYPYVAKSMREFWRRWHLSLSAWFRDYLYIPLGGSRGSPWRVGANLCLVFMLCGLWHGASLPFLVWGIWHGAFLALERSSWFSRIITASSFGGRVYTLLAVGIGWVFFRADSLRQAMMFLRALGGAGAASNYGNGIALFYRPSTYSAIVAGVLLAAGLFAALSGDHKMRRYPLTPGVMEKNYSTGPYLAVVRAILCVTLFLVGISFVVGETFQPFLYFRF